MPNAIGPNGLTTQTRDEIIAELKDGADGFLGFRGIYGPDINLDPNSADGQLINLFAQGKIDVLDFLRAIYTGFDPDQAIGVTLDERVAINGIIRKAGTYSTATLAVVVTQALTLKGLDLYDAADAFSAQDAAGNRFLLLVTQTPVAAGTVSTSFRADQLGAIAVDANTVNTIATIQLGVSSVNNPLAGAIGVNEETDEQLRRRRAASVSLPSKGYLEGLYGGLLAIDGVTSARVLENVGSSPDGNGIPGHSIWCIVKGGTNADVANVIYVKRNAGCGMKGAVAVNITQVDNSVFAVLFDRPTAENLWISFSIAALPGYPAVDATNVRAQLLALLSYDIGQPADASAIVALLKEIVPTAYVSAEGVSDTNSGYVALKATATVDSQWAIAAGRIVINGSHP